MSGSDWYFKAVRPEVASDHPEMDEYSDGKELWAASFENYAANQLCKRAFALKMEELFEEPSSFEDEFD